MSISASTTSAELKHIRALAKNIAKAGKFETSITLTACKAVLKQAGIKQALYQHLWEAVCKIKENQRKAAAQLKLAIKDIALSVEEGEGRINFSKSIAVNALKAAGLKKSLADELVRVVKQLEVDRIKKVAVDVYRSVYRSPDVGHGKESVSGVMDPTLVGISQEQYNDWNFYRGSFKHRPGQVTNTFIRLPLTWMKRVFDEDISLVDKLMTLDASQLPSPLGCKLYAAKWLMQGMGYKVSVQSGYIAKSDDGTAYHANSAIKAIKGLARKSASVAREAEWTKLFNVESIENLAAQLPAKAVVSIGDAKAIGACEYGIQSWCYSTGLPYSKGRAPMTDVIQAYRQEPRVEARAAIIFALRKFRTLAKNAA